MHEATKLSIADDNGDIDICDVKKDWIHTGTEKVFTFKFFYRQLQYYWCPDIERFK